MNGVPPQAEAIKKEILAAAGRQAAAEAARALAEEEELLAAAGAEAAALVAARSQEARAAAARRREALLACVALETGRLRAQLEETRLEAVRSGAAARLGAALNARETAAALAAAAISGMEGSSFTVKVPPGLAGGGSSGLAEEIARRAGRGALEIRVEPDPGCAGGALVLGSGGRQRWDNTLGARLRRLWPELRRRFAESEKGEG